MFTLAILIGIYSYLILTLGLMSFLYKGYIITLTVIYSAVVALKFYVSLRVNRGHLKFMGLPRRLLYSLLAMTNGKVFLGLIITQVLINLIGALGPELGFDALWYHLTFPKLYLDNHSIFYIPGGLLYYSAMPKLTEMLYTAALALNGEILAKLIHFSFGILSLIALFKLSRKFFSPKISLIAVVVFYSNLVVAWQSTTAYVDLARTFFEIMALSGFVNFWKKGEKKWLIESAVMLGLAISTKLLALGSLFIFSALIVTHFLLFLKAPPRRSPFGHLRGVSNKLLVYWVICLLIPLPWFIFSYIHTGNPVYPFFTDTYKVGFTVELLNPFRFIREVWGMFMESADPISPIYIIFLPLVILTFFRHLRDSGRAVRRPDLSEWTRMTTFQIIAIYSFLAIIVWYVTPRTGGGRFILPYLPAFSILVAAITEKLKENSEKIFITTIIILISLVSIAYRGVANAKYAKVLLGKQTKSEFLAKNLNFSFGDFYDTDSYFKKNIKPSDKVLLYGFHNLYYVDFPFIDSSWVKKGDSFNYVAGQNTPSADGLPKRFRDWDLVYQNLQTRTKLYSRGKIKWVY